MMAGLFEACRWPSLRQAALMHDGTDRPPDADGFPAGFFDRMDPSDEAVF